MLQGITEKKNKTKQNPASFMSLFLFLFLRLNYSEWLWVGIQNRHVYWYKLPVKHWLNIQKIQNMPTNYYHNWKTIERHTKGTNKMLWALRKEDITMVANIVYSTICHRECFYLAIQHSWQPCKVGRSCYYFCFSHKY